MATYDWLQAYEASHAGQQTNPDEQSNNFLLQKILGAAGGDFQKAQTAGIIDPSGNVDWSKAPGFSGGGKTPQNTMQVGVGGRAGMTDPWSGKPTQSLTGSYIDDPNYGMQALVQKRAPDSTEMKLLRAGAISMASMPMMAVLGPMLAGGMGVSPATGQILARLLMSSGSTLAQGGNLNFGQMAGSVAGGMTGIPGGSTLGGMAGSQITQGR